MDEKVESTASQQRRKSGIRGLSTSGATTDDGKRLLTEQDAWDVTGFAFPTWKKWAILSVIFTVQMSMNFNTSVYPNVVPGLAEYYGVSEQAARVGQMIFLVTYAFGCELWAPYSEEFGRWPILQLSCFLINIWQLPCALSKNFATVIVGRALGGLSTAGGSVTLGMVADLYKPENQQFAVAFVVLSSVGGTVIGPIFGGFIQEYLDWRWNFWIQLIFGGFTQIIHFILVPETRVTILLDREAKRRRKSGEDDNIYGPNEVKEKRLDIKEFLWLSIRPFEMFLREPIVLCLSLLSGFSDALIFTFLEGFNPVFKQWNFSTVALGLSFCSVWIGYLAAYAIFIPRFIWEGRQRAKDPDALQPEARLYLLLYTAPLETIGLFIFAWTSVGPPIPWIAPLIGAFLIAMANYSIYMTTIDYMVEAYEPYSASATGGNGWARDFLAGIAAMYSAPMYHNIGDRPLQYASTVLGCLAVVVTIPIYVFYWKGPTIRANSKFAQVLASDRKATRQGSSVAGNQGADTNKEGAEKPGDGEELVEEA